MLYTCDALVVLLGVGIGAAAIIGASSTTTNNGVSGQSGFGLGRGLGLSVVEAFSPTYSGMCSNNFVSSCRPGSLSSAALFAQDASSSSAADSAGDTMDDGAGGISEAGHLTKKSGISAKTSEYRPLQRQWWEVRSPLIMLYGYARVLSMPCVMLVYQVIMVHSCVMSSIFDVLRRQWHLQSLPCQTSYGK